MEAADGLEALDVLEKYHFNLVITDLVMPNLNGFHFSGPHSWQVA